MRKHSIDWWFCAFMFVFSMFLAFAFSAYGFAWSSLGMGGAGMVWFWNLLHESRREKK